MKKIILALLTVAIIISSISGCKNAKEDTANLSSYSFVNVDWERSTEYCVETIYFNDDGNCGYYCACGEPVNDDDLCEGYTYDPETQTIYLDFPSTTDETVTKITVKSCDGETLVLDFDGDIRTFEKAVEWYPDYFEEKIKYEGNTYTYLEFNADIFYYDLAESVEYEEDEYLPIPHEKWDLVYHNGDLFVLDSQADEAIAYYADNENYGWSVMIDDPEAEDVYTFALSVTPEDSNYIDGMESMEWETTLLFEDIEAFASLVKTSNDGLISGSTNLAYSEGSWYWRSEIIDDSTEDWPEYVVKLPDSISGQISEYYAQISVQESK